MASARGVLGRLTGAVIARLTAEANEWVVDLLDVQADDWVLDVGCGPGVGVAAAATRASQGYAAGVDGSAEMVRQARRRNRAAIRHGRASVHHADAAALPFTDARFTKAATLNSVQFWPSPSAGLAEMRRVLARGGHIAVVVMARSDDHDDGLPAWVEQLGGAMSAVGFTDLTFENAEFGGVLHWALLAER
jgi:ubiquinone/menaquinone biosynthesis C-methylase UbiE